jgi:hypothetical protein
VRFIDGLLGGLAGFCVAKRPKNHDGAVSRYLMGMAMIERLDELQKRGKAEAGKIWYDCLDAEGRLRIAENLMKPVLPMAKMGAYWGDGFTVQCVGDEGHMLRECNRLRANLFSSVCDKLPIWC